MAICTRVNFVLLLVTALISFFRSAISNADKNCGYLAGFNGDDDYAEPGSLPWIVSIAIGEIPFKRPPMHFCGGTIIGEKWVLTAAHCVHYKTDDSLIVVAGCCANSTDYISKVHELQYISVDFWLEHDEFSIETNENDIALLKLTHPIKYNKYAKAMCLPPEEDNYFRTMCFISAFDKLPHRENIYMSRMKMVQLIPMGLQTCKTMVFEAYRKHYPVFDSNICAGYKTGGHQKCSGNSGGPLICAMPNGRGSQAGISSWGLKCHAGSKFPAVFTRVPNFIRWLTSTMKYYDQRRPEPRKPVTSAPTTIAGQAITIHRNIIHVRSSSNVVLCNPITFIIILPLSVNSIVLF